MRARLRKASLNLLLKLCLSLYAFAERRSDCTDCGIRTARSSAEIFEVEGYYKPITDDLFHGGLYATPPDGYDAHIESQGGGYFSFSQCMVKCNTLGASQCQYAIWTHGVARGQDCTSIGAPSRQGIIDPGLPTYGRQSPEGLCFLYKEYYTADDGSDDDETRRKLDQPHDSAPIDFVEHQERVYEQNISKRHLASTDPYGYIHGNWAQSGDGVSNIGFENKMPWGNFPPDTWFSSTTPGGCVSITDPHTCCRSVNEGSCGGTANDPSSGCHRNKCVMFMDECRPEIHAWTEVNTGSSSTWGTLQERKGSYEAMLYQTEIYINWFYQRERFRDAIHLFSANHNSPNGNTCFEQIPRIPPSPPPPPPPPTPPPPPWPRPPGAWLASNHVNCKVGTYRHSVMRSVLSERRRAQASELDAATTSPPLPPLPPPPFPPPLIPPPSPPPQPSPPPTPYALSLSNRCSPPFAPE